ncbi:MAG: hypothetical protein JO104_02560, partial [Candidatus Eremiobacteraeota bacterium]|nr:hypothetical protein [Candidatus Eremiobacteraeota bacterium]
MSTRAQPTRSWEIACRHLFRHIDEPRELRRNPIAAAFLERNNVVGNDTAAVQAIRSALLEALDGFELLLRTRGQAGHAHRRRAIVECNVLGHRPAAELAAELHISRMQLYRERRAICEQLAKMLADGRAVPPPGVAHVRNPRTAAISRARLLVERCQSERALALLDDVARTCSDPHTLIRATCLQADILVGRLELDKARLHLDTARRFVQTNEVRLGATLTFYRAYVDLAASRLTAQNRPTSTARRASRRALDELLTQPLADESQREIAVDELAEAARQALKEGRFRRFRARLSAASSLFATLHEQSPRQKALLFSLAALLYEEASDSARSGGPDTCRMLAVAEAIANREGLLLTAADATLSRAGVLSYGLGNPGAAVRESLPVVEFALRTGDRRVVGEVCSYVAALRNANREFREALKLAALAARYGKLDRVQEAMVHSYAAQSYFGLGDYRRASATAAKAVELASLTGNQRIIGRMLRVSALSLHACADASASKRINAAVDLLERFGGWDSLRNA